MKNIVFTLLILFIIPVTYAQKAGQALVDSLYAALPGMKEDTNKVRLLAKISYEMRNINAEQGLKEGIAALQLAEKLNDPYGIALSHHSLGSIYYFLSRYPEAIDHDLKAQIILEKIGRFDLLCSIYCHLASDYLILDKDISLNYVRMATALLPKSTDILWKVQNIGGLGNIYRRVGQCDSARKYLTISLKLAEEKHFLYEIMHAKTRFGLLFQMEGKMDSAVKLFKATLEYYKAVGNARMITENSQAIGELLLYQCLEEDSLCSQYLREAEVYAREALNSGMKIRFLEEIYLAHRLLSNIYKRESRSQEALEHLQLAFNYYDSIYGAEIVNEASILTWKQDQELREKQMELLTLQNRQQTIFTLVAIAGIGILIIVILIVITNRRRLKKAYLLVQEQKEEVSRVLSMLENTNRKLEVTNQELTATNQELDAFSYSVSHDLRGPVRRIEGLCDALLEDYTGKIDKPGQEILKHIADSTVLMNQLIEDMLKLSRVTRQSVEKSDCNLSDLATNINNDLKLAYPEQNVDCEVQDDIVVKADPKLMQIALQNLLDNAWKYSSKVEHPEVTVKTEMQNGKMVICIRDNGVGFEMDQAGKLFTPFQRLHSDEEFKGTGIGLATVKRIIQKHGGTIRAESESGKGTTFYFALE